GRAMRIHVDAAACVHWTDTSGGVVAGDRAVGDGCQALEVIEVEARPWSAAVVARDGGVAHGERRAVVADEDETAAAGECRVARDGRAVEREIGRRRVDAAT